MKKKSPRPQRIVRRWRANRRPLKAQDQQRNKSSMNDVDYNIQLANFLAVRYSDQNLPPPAPKFAPSNATSSSAIPSDELIWTRDDSTKMESFEIADSQPESSEQQPGPSHQQTVVDEVEEGEIVEHDDISNLLSQSSLAVKNSRQLVDLSASPSGRRGRNLFYEDRVALKFGSVPIYNTYNDANDSVEQLNTSDDVICIDGSQTEQDDSVIFVCEDKPPPAPVTRSNRRLSVPDCLKSPALSNLLKLVPSQRLPRASTSKAPKAPAVKSPRTIARQKLRITAWKEKKSREFAAKANGEQTEQRMVEPDTTTIEPSTSSADNVQRPEVKPKEPEKRIVLIDGSNVAMQYTDNRGSKKTDKDFAVEGIKIAIDHFEKQGFQVKAVVPEYRLKRDKSSNHALMQELYENGKIVPTPAKSYDDRVILQSALELDAAVVSNDQYRDLREEKPEFAEVLKRLVRFAWVCQTLIIPEDPHGRNGPQLKDILFKKPV